MRLKECLQTVILILLLIVLMTPLYFLHSALVDSLAELSANLAKGIFQSLGLPQ